MQTVVPQRESNINCHWFNGLIILWQPYLMARNVEASNSCHANIWPRAMTNGDECIQKPTCLPWLMWSYLKKFEPIFCSNGLFSESNAFLPFLVLKFILLIWLPVNNGDPTAADVKNFFKNIKYTYSYVTVVFGRTRPKTSQNAS